MAIFKVIDFAFNMLYVTAYISAGLWVIAFIIRYCKKHRRRNRSK